MGKKVDMIGRRFRRWTVVADAGKRTNSGAIVYLCKCDCGNEKIVSGTILRSGQSTSCGCYNHDVITKFGNAVYKEKLYHIWHSMIQRCYNKNDKAFHNYGGRGITVCEDWKSSYQSFKTWALENGYKRGLWIDRSDNNGPYSPANCSFQTPKRQQRNKRTNVMVTIDGITRCMSDWADDAGISLSTIKRRIELNWNGKDLLKPVDRKYSHGDSIKRAMRYKVSKRSDPVDDDSHRNRPR